MMYPPLSVLMPVYVNDDAQYFTLAIESVFRQTVFPNEIVIVEDGPVGKDLSDIINTYKLKYPLCIKVVQLAQNMGMGVAMNTGLNACTHSFIARMDSDDICREDRFEQQFNFFLEHPEVDVVGGIIEEFNTQVGDLKRFRHLPSTHEAIIKFSKKRNPINHMTVMFKKQQAIEAGGYWSRRYFEDYHLWYQMLLRGCVFYNLPTVLVDVRIGNNMVARRKGITYFKNEVPLFLSMYNNKFISFSQFVLILLGRLISRILPLPVLKTIYKLFLRKKITNFN